MKILEDLAREGWDEQDHHPITKEESTSDCRTFLFDVPLGYHMLNIMYEPDGADETQVQTCKLYATPTGTYSVNYVHQKILPSKKDMVVTREVRKQLALLAVEEGL